MSQTDGKLPRTSKHRGLFLILSITIILIVMLHFGFFIFLNINGKSIITGVIKNNFGVTSEVENISFRFPFTVVVRGFKCGDLSFAKANIFMGLFNPFNRSINLHKVYIDHLHLGVKRTKDKINIEPLLAESISKEQAVDKKAEELTFDKVRKPSKKNISLRIRRLYLNKASVEIIDTTRDVPVIFLLRDIDVRVKNFSYPKLGKFYINFDASLTKEAIIIDNLINIRGWVDYVRKNMDVKLEVHKLAYSVFAQYLPAFWRPENLGIKEGIFSLDTSFKSTNNDLVIEGILSLDNIDFNEIPEKKTNLDLVRTIVALLKGNSENATLPIRLKAKMDAFRLDFSSLQSQFQNKVKIDVGTIIVGVLDKTANKTKERVDDGIENIQKVAEETKNAVTDNTAVVVDKPVDTTNQVTDKVENITSPTQEKTAAEAVIMPSNSPEQDKEKVQNNTATQSAQ